MSSVNMIVLSGHLGAPPEERTSEAGKRYCKFRLANHRWDAKKKAEVADWYTVIAFGSDAEQCIKRLGKGSHVVVEGRIALREWENKEGHKMREAEVWASRVNFLGSPRASADGPTATSPKAPSSSSPATYDVDSIPF
ncbi:MAG: single-stranded DNA-binding protein [Deltaproteobacteria bacterium]|nr:single-stranded DNA-binding protein [Deltaproteobacteria bacterium]